MDKQTNLLHVSVKSVLFIVVPSFQGALIKQLHCTRTHTYVTCCDLMYRIGVAGSRGSLDHSLSRSLILYEGEGGGEGEGDRERE